MDMGSRVWLKLQIGSVMRVHCLLVNAWMQNLCDVPRDNVGQRLVAISGGQIIYRFIVKLTCTQLFPYGSPPVPLKASIPSSDWPKKHNVNFALRITPVNAYCSIYCSSCLKLDFQEIATYKWLSIFTALVANPHAPHYVFTLLVGFARISGSSPEPVGGQLPPFASPMAKLMPHNA